MRDRLLGYYERELGFIRGMAQEFAAKYPEVAGRLLLEPTKCEDPHVERLIEAFAMMSARVQLRIDDRERCGVDPVSGHGLERRADQQPLELGVPALRARGTEHASGIGNALVERRRFEICFPSNGFGYRHGRTEHASRRAHSPARQGE